MDICFSAVTNKYYNRDGETFFNPLHSGQYGVFLYYLSNEAFKHDEIKLAEKIYYLNKALNCVEWFYEINLPEHFFADHPLGCVLGRANYGDYLCVGQGVTVGNNHNLYPTIGKNVTIHPYSSIIGKSVIGDNVEISMYTMIKDETIPSDCLVFGQSPNLIIKQRSHQEMMQRLCQFRVEKKYE